MRRILAILALSIHLCLAGPLLPVWAAEPPVKLVFAYGAVNNNLIGITANSNSQAGIYLGSGSQNNAIRNVNVNENRYGIHFAGSGFNSIENVYAARNGRAIYFFSSPATLLFGSL